MIGSFLLGTIEMLVVGLAALVLVVGAAAWLRLQAPPTLAVSRRVHPDRLHVGSEGRIDLLVENLGTRDHSPARRHRLVRRGPPRGAVPRAAAARRAPPPAPRTGSRPAVAAATASVRSRSASTDPFGVARRNEPSAGEAELVVRPRVHDIVAPVAVGSRISAEHEAAAAARRS